MEKKKYVTGTPPMPLTKTNALESTNIITDSEGTKSTCSFAASSTESIQIVVEQQPENLNSWISKSILTNPAWYRDDEGRTGFKPKFWYHNCQEQEQPEKEHKNQQLDMRVPDSKQSGKGLKSAMTEKSDNYYVDMINDKIDEPSVSNTDQSSHIVCGNSTENNADIPQVSIIDGKTRKNVYSVDVKHPSSKVLKLNKTSVISRTPVKSVCTNRNSNNSCSNGCNSYSGYVIGSRIYMDNKSGDVTDPCPAQSVSCTTSETTTPTTSTEPNVQQTQATNSEHTTQQSDSKCRTSSCNLQCARKEQPCSLYCLRKKRPAVGGNVRNRVPEECKLLKCKSKSCKGVSCVSFLLNSSLSDSIIVEKESLNCYDLHGHSLNTFDEQSTIDQSMFSSFTCSDPPYGVDPGKLTDTIDDNDGCYRLYGIGNKDNDENEFQKYVTLKKLNRALIHQDFFGTKTYENFNDEFSEYLNIDFGRRKRSTAKLLPALPRSASGYFEQNYTDPYNENDSLVSGYLENLQDLMQTSYYENVPTTKNFYKKQDNKNIRMANILLNEGYREHFDDIFSATLATPTTVPTATTTLTTTSNIATAATTAETVASATVSTATASTPSTTTTSLNDRSSRQLTPAIFGADTSINWKDVGDLEDYLLDLKLGPESIASSNESLMSMTSSAAETLIRRNFNY